MNTHNILYRSITPPPVQSLLHASPVPSPYEDMRKSVSYSRPQAGFGLDLSRADLTVASGSTSVSTHFPQGSLSSQCRSRPDSRAIGTAMKALQTRNAQLEDEIRDLRSSFSKQDSENDQHTQIVKGLQDQVLTYEARIAELESRLGEANRENDRRALDSASDKQNLMTYQETLQGENRRLQDILLERDRTISEQAEQCRQQAAQNEQLVSENRKLASEQQALRDAAAKYSAEAAATIAPLRHKYKAGKQQIASLNRTVEELCDEINTLKRAIRISEESRDAILQVQRTGRYNPATSTSRSVRKARKRSPLKARNMSHSFSIPNTSVSAGSSQEVSRLEKELLVCTRIYSQLLQKSKDPNISRSLVSEELAKVARDMEEKRAQISLAKATLPYQ